MKRIITLGLLLVVALCLPGAALAQDGEAAVGGRVINDTDAAAPLGGIEVSLHSYADDSLSASRTTVTDDAGAFRFDDVATGQEHLVAAAYQGADYYQQVIFSPGATEAFVEVHVVAATDSDAVVSVPTRHIIIGFTENSLEITEIFRVVNDTDMTVVRDNGSLAFTLPREAGDVRFLTGSAEDYLYGEDGRLLYMAPLPPGEAEFVIGYSLPPAENGVNSLSFTADYPVADLEVLLSGEGIEVSSSDLAPADPVTAGDGRRFLHYTGGNLPRGTGFSLTVSRGASGGNYMWVIYVVAALAVIVVAWVLLKKRRKSTGQ